jgi:hypothetical protein
VLGGRLSRSRQGPGAGEGANSDHWRLGVWAVGYLGISGLGITGTKTGRASRLGGFEAARAGSNETEGDRGASGGPR